MDYAGKYQTLEGYISKDIYRGVPIQSVCTLCPLYDPEQGNIVGRKYIHFV
jgi:hypothetical protein